MQPKYLNLNTLSIPIFLGSKSQSVSLSSAGTDTPRGIYTSPDFSAMAFKGLWMEQLKDEKGLSSETNLRKLLHELHELLDLRGKTMIHRPEYHQRCCLIFQVQVRQIGAVKEIKNSTKECLKEFTFEQ